MRAKTRFNRREAGVLLLGLILGALPAYGGDPSGKARQGQFSWNEELDAATGWTVWRLSYDDPDEPRKSQSIRVCPQAGANLFSYEIGGDELLHFPDRLSALQRGGGGTPVLYPTPNRVRGGRFSFEGREFSLSDDGKTTLHGLVLSIPWEFDRPVFQGSGQATEGVSLRLWVDFEPGSAHFNRFPIRHRLELTYRLGARGTTAQFAVINHDKERLPFGIGLHPYFRILGLRELTFVQVPAEKKMEATPDLLPTGRLQPLEGAPYDLRHPRALSELSLDDVFWGMRPERPAGYEARDAGLRVSLPASPDFTHMVVYTPEGRPYVCLENQTCSTDAHNLHARGLAAESNLLVVEPGGTWSGWVEFRPEWTR
jgi:aldose 1-epimerase